MLTLVLSFPCSQWGTLFMRFPYFICPCRNLGMSFFSDVQCDPNPVFLWNYLPLPDWLSAGLRALTGWTITRFPWAPFQIHVAVMAVFASLVAPFGGFFASGFKRAFNIKDFGDSIPGHGGMTDRMDCQCVPSLGSDHSLMDLLFWLTCILARARPQSDSSWAYSATFTTVLSSEPTRSAWRVCWRPL